MRARRRPPRMTTVERDGRTEAAVAIPIAGDRRQVAVLSSVVSTLVGVGLLVKGELVFTAIARLHEDPAGRRRIATGELAAERGGDANLTPASPR